MASVWYIGGSMVRTILAAEWVAAGFPAGTTVTWSRENGWSVPEAMFSSEQLNLLHANGFLIGQPDGPRPGPVPEVNPNRAARYDEVLTLISAVETETAEKYAPSRSASLVSGDALRAISQRSKSHTQANARNAAAVSTVAVEDWADLVGWTPAVAGGVVVSAGKLFAGAPVSGKNKATFPLNRAANGRFRAVFVVDHIVNEPTGSSGDVIIGFSTDAANAVPSTGAAGMYAVSVSTTDTKGVRGFTSGASVNLSSYTNGSPTGVYTFTLTIDDTHASVAVRRDSGADEYFMRWPLSSFTPTTLVIFNSDVRGLTGSSVRGFSTVREITSIPAFQTAPAPLSHFSISGSVGLRVTTPIGYDATMPTPAVVMFHGATSDDGHWGTNTNGKAVADAFLAAGFIVIAAGHLTNKVTYGAQASLDGYARAYDLARANYNIGAVVYYGNSMGGIESLLSLSQAQIPGVAAWIGSVPTASLYACWSPASGFLDRTSEIRNAYGIATDGTDYAVKTAGHDPLLVDPELYRGVPMLAVVATDDLSVDYTRNWIPFSEKMTPHVTEIQTIWATGGHSTTAIANNGPAMVAFARKHAGV